MSDMAIFIEDNPSASVRQAAARPHMFVVESFTTFNSRYSSHCVVYDTLGRVIDSFDTDLNDRVKRDPVDAAWSRGYRIGQYLGRGTFMLMS